MNKFKCDLCKKDKIEEMIYCFEYPTGKNWDEVSLCKSCAGKLKKEYNNLKKKLK